MTDYQIAQQVKEYLRTHPQVTRTEFRRKLGISAYRIDKLEAAKLIPAILKLTKSQGATMNRKNKDLMRGWYINKPTVFESAR